MTCPRATVPCVIGEWGSHPPCQVSAVRAPPKRAPTAIEKNSLGSRNSTTAKTHDAKQWLMQLNNNHSTFHMKAIIHETHKNSHGLCNSMTSKTQPTRRLSKAIVHSDQKQKFIQIKSNSSFSSTTTKTTIPRRLGSSTAGSILTNQSWRSGSRSNDRQGFSSPLWVQGLCSHSCCMLRSCNCKQNCDTTAQTIN